MTDAAPREGWYVATTHLNARTCVLWDGREWWSFNGYEVNPFPPGWTLGPRIEDLLSREQKGQNEPCYHCGKPCNSLAGNPLLWPTMVPAERSCRPMHMGCVADLLRDAALYRKLRERVFRQGRVLEEVLTTLTRTLDDFDAEIAREKGHADG